jgi:hypothetical protein
MRKNIKKGGGNPQQYKPMWITRSSYNEPEPKKYMVTRADRYIPEPVQPEPNYPTEIDINEKIYDSKMQKESSIKELLDNDEYNIVIDNHKERRVININEIKKIYDDYVYSCYKRTGSVDSYRLFSNGQVDFGKKIAEFGNVSPDKYVDLTKLGFEYDVYYIKLSDLQNIVDNYEPNKKEKRAYTLIKTGIMPSISSSSILDYKTRGTDLHCNTGPSDTYILEKAYLYDLTKNQNAGRKRQSKNNKSLLKKASPKRKSKTEKRKSPNKRN